MHSDPISDMLTRIRNASQVRQSEVWLPYSKLKLNILDLLAQEGWISSVERVSPAATGKISRAVKKSDQERARFEQIKVVLKYGEDRKPIARVLRRVSTPGKRVYVGKYGIPTVLNGMGTAIISTSQGILTGTEAKKRGLGGEVLCEVY